MEGIAATAYAGIKAYCRRKGYRRLNANDRPIDGAAATLGSQPKNRRRFRLRRPRLKLGRIRFRLGSVRKFFLKMRDAYVNAMLGMASKGIFSGGGVGGFVAGGGQPKEYDEKMVVEIYKRIVFAQQQAQLARKFGSDVAPVCLFH